MACAPRRAVGVDAGAGVFYAASTEFLVTMILMTKRVVVAKVPEQAIEVALADAPQRSVVARVPVGPPVVSGAQIGHLEAWRLVRAELSTIRSPEIVGFFNLFMGLVEAPTQHIFISTQALAFNLKSMALAEVRAPVIAVAGPASAESALRDGTLLVHMIPGLPGAGKDAWAYDVGKMSAPTGFEVCSLTLVRRDATIYGYPYGLFAVVPENEVLAIGVNDLGVNKFKKDHSGQGHTEDELRRLLVASLERTHADDVVTRYGDYDQLRRTKKRTPSNEIVANLKARHLIAICVNLAHLNISRLRPKRPVQIAAICKETALIQTAVQRMIGVLLPIYTYDHNAGTLALLAQLK